MDVIMGFVAALLWGGTDFLVGLNARAVGVKRAVFFGQTLGFALMSVLLLLYPFYFIKSLSASSVIWGLGLAAALCTVAGALALSKAFALGKTAVIAPLITSYGVFTTALAWASGDVIIFSQFAGILICVIGVLITSIHTGADVNINRQNRVSVFFGLVAAILYGTSFWIQGKYTLPILGPITMLWLGYAVGLFVLFFIVIKLDAGLKLPAPRNIGFLTMASLLNLGGFSAFSWGAINGSVSVVTVISTLSGGIAAVLGCLVFKERLGGWQVGGVLLVLMGAVILHMFN
ncbi:DMT family transporter [Pseudomonas sp. Y39-6]|jgi:drug/metabolite transporter (DMT)-like permease|uniref:DMT family transporter n=1 Tax=Pseudomonas sp. Y39-6 TaxID=2749807 RepID=UPI001910FBBD|nr:DMT family transporter [Pseudomonas sp. Y39-6]QPO23579.1 DMT family transporter [Pseudomonas sp. Y39-6]URS60904.1 DMT family transporter [Pseudomonas sp. Y39-6]